ncbi:MAG: RHS repeat-associated core domain-containing protein [Galactobacter sp.]
MHRGLVKGCRALVLSYDQKTSKGDPAKGKVAKVVYTAWDADEGKMSTVPIAEYSYSGTSEDANLRSVKDSRTGDTTTYTYGADSAAGVPLLASITEKASNGSLTGAPTYYNYGKANGTTRADWLESVDRGKPSDGSGKVQVARFVYGVKPAGNGTDLPDLSSKTTGLWEQDAPVAGYAVFGAGKTVTSSKATSVGAADFKYADLQFVDTQNRVVNTGSYAAGAWQVTVNVFNADGNVTDAYDERGIRTLLERAKDPQNIEDGVVVGHTDQATHTVFFGDTTATAADLASFVDENGVGKVTVEAGASADEKAGSRAENEAIATMLRGSVLETFSPVGTDEGGAPARVRTTTTYTPVSDKDAGGMPRMLSLKEVTSKAEAGELDVDSAPVGVISEVVNGYDALSVDAAGKPVTDKANARSGWVVGSPTTVTTKLGASAAQDITTTTGYDDQGRVIESRQPKSTGADAGTTNTVYYSAAANTAEPSCGSKPEFAGYLCKSIPRGAGSVTKYQTSFNVYGQPATFTESSTGGDGAKRTTTQTYRADGQEDTTTVSTSGLTSSTAVASTQRVYDSAGVQTGTKALAGAGQPASQVSWKQDLWGRTTSYTNSLGDTTTTEYDGFGNVAKTVSPVSTSTYKYGALSGDGTTEYQGVVTSMTISGHGGESKTGTYTASYDGDGNLLKQTMPGGISQVQEYDMAGKPTRLAYEGPLKDEDGHTSSGTWVAWETVRDVTGRIVGEETPDGDVLTGTTTSGDRGAAYDRAFEYDMAGRLTQVTGITANAGEVINTDPDEGVTTPVSVRKYAFDKNGNRTGLTTTVDGKQTSSRSWTYGAADRMTGGSVYDGLGRQTTIPAADAPRAGDTPAGSGPITLSYFDDDSAHTISRGGATTSITEDPAGRRLNLSTTGAGATQSGVEVKHYVDDSDTPGYATREIGGKTLTTRYESTIGNDLALTIAGDRVELAVNNPHGDTVTTIPLTGEDAGTGIKGWSQYDEYGNQQGEAAPDTGATTYGWHGADQRALNPDSGLILMGARLYNPTTGSFTSTDSVPGGNTTAYTYPQDPVNADDTSGEWPKWMKRAARGVGRVTGWASDVVSYCAHPGCKAASAVLGLGSAGAWALAGKKKIAGKRLRKTVLNAFLPAGLSKSASLFRFGKSSFKAAKRVGYKRYGSHAYSRANRLLKKKSWRRRTYSNIAYTSVRSSVVWLSQRSGYKKRNSRRTYYR